MKIRQLTVVQRVVLSIAVPSVALLLLWPVHWVTRLGLIINDKRDEIVHPEFLRDQMWFGAVAMAVVAAWLCLLWARRDGGSRSSTALSNTPQQPESASGVRVATSLEPLHAAKELFIAGANIRRAAWRAGIKEPPFDEDGSLPLRLHALMRPEGRAVVLERLEWLLRRVQDCPLRGGFWKDLMRAAEALGLQDRRAFFADRFQQALQASAARRPDGVS